MMFCYLLLTSILATAHSWVLTSTHTNIIPQLMDDVILHCFYEGSEYVFDTATEITRIRLLKMDDKKAWNEYAEIGVPNTTLVELFGPNVPGLLASGHVGYLNESYLSVTWTKSSEDI